MTRVPYGWAAGVSTECCIASATDSHRMLCGRWAGFVPEVPPVFPQRVHARCQELWDSGLREPDEPLDGYGCCPVCHGEVPLAGVLVGAHGQWTVGRFGPRVSGEPCAGEGMQPEVEG